MADVTSSVVAHAKRQIMSKNLFSPFFFFWRRMFAITLSASRVKIGNEKMRKLYCDGVQCRRRLWSILAFELAFNYPKQ